MFADRDDFYSKLKIIPLKGKLSSFSPVTLSLASKNPDLEPVWDFIVKTFHYLGYHRLLGHRLKYLAFIDHIPVAALSWSAPALRLGQRDRFIGWSEDQRKLFLVHIANNSRLLIPEWVTIPNLVSHVLALNIKRLALDWKQSFGHDLWFLETFVDSQKYKGTCYRASNWIYLGKTKGATKFGRIFIYHGLKKDIYGYILNSNFRKLIGCSQTDFPIKRPTIYKQQIGELRMLLQNTEFNTASMPEVNLDDQGIKVMADDLLKFHENFHEFFGGSKNERLGSTYLSGLLSKIESKSVEPIALEFLGKQSVRSLQKFMTNNIWDEDKVLDKNQQILAKLISSPEGMITIDSSEIEKKGKESVGVARQYCGRLGKVENCQSGVFVGYTGPEGYGLVDSKLYLPEKWFSDEYDERRTKTDVPGSLIFKTKPKIALDLIQNTIQKGYFKAKWIGCDATFGQNRDFLEGLPNDLIYFASIRSNTKVFLKEPLVGIQPQDGKTKPSKKEKIINDAKSISVKDVSELKTFKWETLVLGEGAKGPIIAEVGRIRIIYSKNNFPAGEWEWLFLKKDADGQISYAFSNAPEDLPLETMAQASLMRWPIEQCFENGKSHLGMDQYEHRSWTAWHRHMTYVILGLTFLLITKQKLKKKFVIKFPYDLPPFGSSLT